MLCSALLVPTLRQSQTTGFPSLLMNLERTVSSFSLPTLSSSLVHRYIPFVGGKGKGMILPFSCSLFRLSSVTAVCVKQGTEQPTKQDQVDSVFLYTMVLHSVWERHHTPLRRWRFKSLSPEHIFPNADFCRVHKPSKSHSRHQIRTLPLTHTQNRVLSSNTDN